MTIEERNNKLKHLITCMKCEVSGKSCDENCPTQYDAGNMGEIIENLEAISKVLEQEPRCRECKWWKDSDGKYRRGIGAESQCSMNTHAVYCGDGYCYKFSPKAYEEVEE